MEFASASEAFSMPSPAPNSKESAPRIAYDGQIDSRLSIFIVVVARSIAGPGFTMDDIAEGRRRREKPRMNRLRESSETFYTALNKYAPGSRLAFFGVAREGYHERASVILKKKNFAREKARRKILYNL